MSPTSTGAVWITCCMAKTRCCRFHNVFIALLVLSVFSLTGHFLIDIVHLPHQQAVDGQRQSLGDNSLSSQEVGHATSLHGGYILTEIPVLGQARTVIAPSDLPPPFGVPWQAPTPLRPPISF